MRPATFKDTANSQKGSKEFSAHSNANNNNNNNNNNDREVFKAQKGKNLQRGTGNQRKATKKKGWWSTGGTKELVGLILIFLIWKRGWRTRLPLTPPLRGPFIFGIVVANLVRNVRKKVNKKDEACKIAEEMAVVMNNRRHNSSRGRRIYEATVVAPWSISMRSRKSMYAHACMCMCVWEREREKICSSCLRIMWTKLWIYTLTLLCVLVSAVHPRVCVCLHVRLRRTKYKYMEVIIYVRANRLEGAKYHCMYKHRHYCLSLLI